MNDYMKKQLKKADRGVTDEYAIGKHGTKHIVHGAKSEALKKKKEHGVGEHSKVSFTPRTESERKKFKKYFQ